MRLLLDTHFVLWASLLPRRLPETARLLIVDPDNEVLFSAASLWEVAIKHGLGRPDFAVDPGVLRDALLQNRFAELAISGLHAIALRGLPKLHRDPFDRILVAQSVAEGIPLLTSDAQIALYPGQIRLV